MPSGLVCLTLNLQYNCELTDVSFEEVRSNNENVFKLNLTMVSFEKLTIIKDLIVTSPKKVVTTRMWANAQRDGRHAEHRWRPLFNAAKFG